MEVKTTDAFTIRTATLLGYINSLIDAGRIPSADTALGLYVFGRPTLNMEQLEASIIQAGHSQRLRTATVNDVLSLAELVQQQLLIHEETIALLRPVGVRVGSTVQILKRLAAGVVAAPPPPAQIDPQVIAPAHETPLPHTSKQAADSMYLLTPVTSEAGASADDTIRSLLDQGIYVFGDRTTRRSRLKPGDKIAFYESGKGVVAAAEAASRPERKTVTFAKPTDRYPWAFSVTNVQYFFNNPVILDA